MSIPSTALSKRAYRIPDVIRITGLGRSSVYSAIADGSLQVRKFGRATLVLDGDLLRFLEKLPVAHPQIKTTKD